MDLKKAYILFLALALSVATVSAQQTNGQSSVFSTSTNEKNQIELYPNPAVDYLIVEISNPSITNAEFELHSIIGNRIRIEPEEIGYNRFRIPLKDYSTGYYFLVIRDEFSRFKKAYKFLKN